MLWIALHLPLLSLETFSATLQPAAADEPAAPAEAASSWAGPPVALADAQRLITAANAAAQALGIQPGVKRATALALAPQLLLGQADAARDAQALVAVAHAALAFTPMVVIEPADAAAPDTVLLEVHASLRYFGGLQPLLRRLQAAIAPLHHRVQWACAPTPLGAALLARVHRQLHCADAAALRQALDAAPVWLLGPARQHWEALQGMGLRRLADLRRLPRAGLARRFGQALLHDLDRALGERPDPRDPIVLPPRFESRLELFARADTTEQVLHGAGVLLARLVAWLDAGHAFARRFTLVMQHEPRWRSDGGLPAATELPVALAEPSRDRAHLQLLLRERLAALQLPAPTIELRLLAADTVQRAPPNGELFPTAAGEREGLVRLVERLQARLGAAQVQRASCVPDHRPEHATAWQAATPGLNPARKPAARPPPAPATHPVWLLDPPEPLADRAQRPLLEGRPLQLLSGPERIESGWWDGELAERDYFIAQCAGGALVWIYRARLPSRAEGASAQDGWFLHGRFG
jgi:protein ImuB